jgi:hypothetical protein
VVGFIREVFHPEWLANPVVVRKKNTNEWRMCIDYTNLNKHCPKEPFELLRIDQVIDSIAGCDQLCFLDCYSGYHQIAIKEEDQEKTTFITPFGAYCYTTMSFGLKNASTTYQQAIQACFKKQLNNNVEAYVDDVVVKTRTPTRLSPILTFASLREYQWKLNPNNCIFCVPSGKLLGFIISHRGIEANPEKISAITEMKAPTCVKDVQKLTGCMAALNRFISKLGERVDPRGRPSFGPAQGFSVQDTSPHGSSQKQAATALPCCNYSCGQYYHHRRAARRRPCLPNPVTSLLHQRGPLRI